MITKYELLNYLHDKFDVTINQITEDLNISGEDIDKIKDWLKELIKEDWIVEAKTMDGEQYDPGKKLDFGGIRG